MLNGEVITFDNPVYNVAAKAGERETVDITVTYIDGGMVFDEESDDADFMLEDITAEGLLKIADAIAKQKEIK